MFTNQTTDWLPSYEQALTEVLKCVVSVSNTHLILDSTRTMDCQPFGPLPWTTVAEIVSLPGWKNLEGSDVLAENSDSNFFRQILKMKRARLCGRGGCDTCIQEADHAPSWTALMVCLHASLPAFNITSLPPLVSFWSLVLSGKCLEELRSRQTLASSPEPRLRSLSHPRHDMNLVTIEFSEEEDVCVFSMHDWLSRLWS